MATLRTIKGFKETARRIKVTLSGWDGKSYDGEAFSRNVWVNDLHPGKQFIMVPFYSESCGRVPCFHEIKDECHSVSGERMAEFYCDVL